MAPERERLALLRSLARLDTDPEAAFDHIAELAAHLCGEPVGELVEAGRSIEKPLTLQRLARVVRDALDQRASKTIG